MIHIPGRIVKCVQSRYECSKFSIRTPGNCATATASAATDDDADSVVVVVVVDDDDGEL